MKKNLIFVGAFSLLLACSESKENSVSNNGESLIAAGGQTEAELAKSLEEFNKAEEKRIAEEKAKTTSLKFDRVFHDFGDIKPDSDNSCRFEVFNTGDKPLIIEKVEASCGCTTPHKPEKPIPPGKSDFIEVGFHPNPGQVNEITKTVTVTANTIEKIHELKIRSFVK